MGVCVSAIMSTCGTTDTPLWASRGVGGRRRTTFTSTIAPTLTPWSFQSGHVPQDGQTGRRGRRPLCSGVDEVGVETDMYPELPKAVTLSQSYPNPINPVTTISYSLRSPSKPCCR